MQLSTIFQLYSGGQFLQLLGYPIDHVIDCLINESKVAGQKSQCMKVGITIFTTIHPSKIYANYL
jgi:hypothetical protein